MYDCVILAAGASSRMMLGRLKPLLPFPATPTGDSPVGEKTLVETSVAAALGCLARVILVVGCRGGEVAPLFSGAAYEAALAEGRLLLVRNPRWEEGMVGSIQSALGLVLGEAFFVAHADMPFIRSDDYRALADARARAAARTGAKEAAFFASFRGEIGHPVLIPSAWIPAIAALGPGEKLRPFFADRPSILVETGEGALRDIDTPSDYEAAFKPCK